MRMLQPGRFRCLATLALLAAIPACDEPVAPEDSGDELVAVTVADRVVGGEAGIPIDAGVVVHIVSVGQCASDAELGRLTLVGTGLAAGLGPFELEYGYCIPTFEDWSIVLRTSAGELTMVPVAGTPIVPSDHPDFDIESHATWAIVDGTRKFERASGELQADFYANLTDEGELADGAITTFLSGTIEMGIR